MTKEEFIKAKQLNKVKRDELVEELRTLEQMYINECSEFRIGDKVRVEKSKSYETGFIKKISVSWLNNIEYSLVKAKEDGTASNIRLYVWSGEKIELLP